MEATWLRTGDEVAGWIVEVEEEEGVDDEGDDELGIITIDGIVAEASTVSTVVDVEVPEVTSSVVVEGTTTTMVVVGRFVGSVAVPESVVLDGAAVPSINDVFGCWF
jgi:hypothetical protein